MRTLLLTLLLGCNTGTVKVPVDTGETGDAACTATAEVCDGVDNDCDDLIDDADPDRTGASTWHADDDGDGYGASTTSDLACAQPEGWVSDATDCDDAHAEAHPDGSEVCDSLDNDCDTLVDGQDDSLTGATAWYPDADGDGYGGDATAEYACTAPVGKVSDNTDCADSEAARNPGETEVCDNFDNDCDDLVDGQDDSLSGATTWYTDEDRDGYGDPATGQIACNQPNGTVSNDGDCDDADSQINPSEAEVCDDIDDDCDGLVDGHDDSLVGGTTYYADTDGDGYGDARNTTEACSLPGGYVTNSTDCNDTDPNIGHC